MKQVFLKGKLIFFKKKNNKTKKEGQAKQNQARQGSGL